LLNQFIISLKFIQCIKNRPLSILWYHGLQPVDFIHSRTEVRDTIY
jgi:hypothetical protein